MDHFASKLLLFLVFVMQVCCSQLASNISSLGSSKYSFGSEGKLERVAVHLEITR